MQILLLQHLNGISGELFVNRFPKYTHAILNPPYKKIKSDSETPFGIETG
jgi:hypothetical protein